MKKSEKSTVSKILRLPDEMNDRLKAMADDRGISQNEFIIKAIDAYLESKNNDDTIPSIGLDTTPKIGLDTMDSIIELIAPRFLALESKIEGLEQQLKTIVESGSTPQKTPPKKEKTIAPGVGTIADQILQLMADGREWSNEELRPHFPGKRITGNLSRLKRKGAIEQVKSESGKEIPGVHRIVKA